MKPNPANPSAEAPASTQPHIHRQPAATPANRRVYRLVPSVAGLRLQQSEEPAPRPGPHEVLVRIEAASLNYRDLLVLRGGLGQVRTGLVPLSDGAGRVVATGPEVTHWQEGDRVAPIFYPAWHSGPFQETYLASALGGGSSDGVLSDLIVVPESSLVRIPAALTFDEAATLPCAAVTTWQALVTRGRLLPGDTVLVQGTGGVALFALQFATVLGARVIVLSSSEEKRERATRLGAWATVNYKTTPDWDVEVRRLTGGIGVSHVLELGGPATYDRSLRALAAGGRIAQIGVFTGMGPQSNLLRLQLINADINGINVGSREHFATMNEFLATHRIKPVIDRRFAFDETEAAYEHLTSGRHFGKVVIKFEATERTAGETHSKETNRGTIMLHPVTAYRPVVDIPFADSESARTHFESALLYETDCWSVHAAITQGYTDFILLDVRTPESFKAEHIESAINLYYRDINESNLTRYPSDALFVVYCSGPHCSAADRAAASIAGLGRKVKKMIGGIAGWKDDGFALVTG
ncbi:MAG: zinc-binding dehydrogenase [Opitutae bacterium]|nr:zinc-binding dehydrogenase [Opitutae bacterium]